MKLPKEILPSLNGIVPSSMATCSKNGVPNVGVISQVFYVNENQVAISHQFFSKTSQNLQENPKAHIQVMDPSNSCPWFLEVEFSHSENSGEVFDQMDMQLEAIASTCGMEEVFSLEAAYIFNVLSVRKGDETQSH
ncbi:pyridoxamine 5'-phosphate oxidase family protein [Leptospira sp. 96542]|nr:pyridoxamine 5'-phosphate oxidase family protein [Leptospira sp. 96542]